MAKIVDVNGNPVVANCIFSYKDYEISYTQIFRPYEVAIFYKDRQVASGFYSVEEAINHVNSYPKGCHD